MARFASGEISGPGSFVLLAILRKAGCDVLVFLEYLEDFPGIEGFEGEEGVPVDLKVPAAEASLEVSASSISAILVAESKRRSRRISSSISF